MSTGGGSDDPVTYRRRRDRLGLTGLGLLLVGAALTAVGYAADVGAALVVGIVVLVLALAALRARAWVRKAAVLGEVGRDLHVPPHDD